MASAGDYNAIRREAPHKGFDGITIGPLPTADYADPLTVPDIHAIPIAAIPSRRSAERASPRYQPEVATSSTTRTSAVRRLKADGVGATEIARRLSLGRASVHRILSATS
jgi:hypothetical protein